MQPIIDGDILRYEVGYMSQPKDEDGEEVILSFDRVAYLLDERIRVICEEVGATKPPIIFITIDKRLAKIRGEKYIPNFRVDIAKTKPYKGTRKTDKPFHFNNLTAYLLSEYNCNISNGIEADDAMCIEQMSNLCSTEDTFGELTIICSRDKDLRMCPGWHYSWECGKQASIGPVFVDGSREGWLEKKDDGKVIGYGDKLFYYQMLVGDTVDNIPGAPGIGKVKAFKMLNDIDTKIGLYSAVLDIYESMTIDSYEEYFNEQANLLWMVREMKEGKPVMYLPPTED